MLDKQAFLESFHRGIHLLDGATGTSLLQAGMPRGCCQEAWILEHSEVIIQLQRSYAEAGSEIIYAPTFQANSLALSRYGLDADMASINTLLIALSKKAAPTCLIAGNLTTLRACMDTADKRNFDRMTDVYKRQIHALMQGGADLIAAETLLHPLEAKAVLHAAKEEGAFTVMISFALKADGTLRSGHSAEAVFSELEQAGASALGMNCIAADDTLPMLVKRLKQHISVALQAQYRKGRVRRSSCRSCHVHGRHASLHGKRRFPRRRMLRHDTRIYRRLKTYYSIKSKRPCVPSERKVVFS